MALGASYGGSHITPGASGNVYINKKIVNPQYTKIVLALDLFATFSPVVIKIIIKLHVNHDTAFMRLTVVQRWQLVDRDGCSNDRHLSSSFHFAIQ